MIKRMYKVLLLVLSIFLITACGKSDVEKELEEKGCLDIYSEYVTISGVEKEYDYTGEFIEPIPTLTTSNGKLLAFSLSYRDNIDPGTAKIVIGKTNKGEISACSGEIEFKIVIKDEDKISIENATVTGIEKSYIYNGTAIVPEPVVKIDDVALVLNTDYTVSYNNNTEIGTASVLINGIGKYSGTKSIDFTIEEEKKDEEEIKEPVITCLDPVYNGEEQVVATCENGEIGGEWKATNASSTLAVRCVGKGKDNKELIANANCSIQPKNIRDSVVPGLGNDYYERTGLAITPNTVPKVIIGGKTLSYGTDYDVTYRNNIEAGAAKVVITGKGNYTGTIEHTAFYIYSEKCQKASQGLSDVIIMEGNRIEDKSGMYKTESNSYHIEIYPDESAQIKYVIPVVCTPFVKRTTVNVGSYQEGWSKYLSVSYNDVDSSIKDKEKSYKDIKDYIDDDGNIVYVMTITPTQTAIDYVNNKGKATPEFKFRQYRTYATEIKGSINFSGGEISVKVIPKDMTKKAQEKSNRCCCYYKDLTKCSVYLDVSSCPKDQPYEDIDKLACEKYFNPTPAPTITPVITLPPKVTPTPTPTPKNIERTPTPTPKNIERTPSPTPVTHSCTLTYNSSTGKLSITGSASNGSKVTKTLIEGAATSSITPTTSKTYSGMVYFDDGKSAKCSRYVTVTPTPTPTSTAYTTSGQAPVCGSVDGASTNWTTGNRYICVSCSTCKQKAYCKTFSSNNTSDITTGIITITGTNGQTKDCTVNVYLRKKNVDSRVCCCTSIQRTNCKMLSGSCDSTYRVSSNMSYCQ